MSAAPKIRHTEDKSLNEFVISGADLHGEVYMLPQSQVRYRPLSTQDPPDKFTKLKASDLLDAILSYGLPQAVPGTTVPAVHRLLPNSYMRKLTSTLISLL